MNGRSGVFQPIRPHSRTYQGFEVSFHRELISTIRTGAIETIRTVHTNHLFDDCAAAFVSTVTVLMDILLWKRRQLNASPVWDQAHLWTIVKRPKGTTALWLCGHTRN